MNFSDDPRRVAIEPMHNFMEAWAKWGRFRPIRYESMTYKIMCWLEDHNNKTVREEREKGSEGQTPHFEDKIEDFELIAWKTEHYLVKLGQQGRREDLRILKTYYRDCTPGTPAYEIARRLGCKQYKIEDIVKDALFQLSLIWMD